MVTKRTGTQAQQAEQLLNAKEVARLLRVSKSFIYALCARGQLRVVRLGHVLRFRPSDVEEYMQRHSDRR